MSSLKLAVLSAACASLVSAAASADITATYLGTGYGKYQSVSFNGSTMWNQAGSGPFYSIRAFDHRWTDQDTGSEFVTWCIELYQGLTVGSVYSFQCVALENAPAAPPSPGPMGLVAANIARDLFCRWADVATGTVVPEGTLAETNAKAAAFCLLVWEISHENFTGLDEATVKGQMSLANGALRANPSADVSNWYDIMFTSLGVGGWCTSDTQGLVSGEAQDQAHLVPAPGALALLALVGVAGRRRRR